MPGSVSHIFHLSLAEQLRIIGCDDVVFFSNLLFEHRQNLRFWICRARTGEVLKVSELFGEVQQHTDTRHLRSMVRRKYLRFNCTSVTLFH